MFHWFLTSCFYSLQTTLQLNLLLQLPLVRDYLFSVTSFPKYQMLLPKSNVNGWSWRKHKHSGRVMVGPKNYRGISEKLTWIQYLTCNYTNKFNSYIYQLPHFDLLLIFTELCCCSSFRNLKQIHSNYP